MHNWIRTLASVALVAGAVFGTVVQATSVSEVTVKEMLQNAELVFEGKVTAIEVHETVHGMIRTRVTFTVVDVIKGNLKDDSITLGFLGGESKGKRVTVSRMQLPELNERGIYFVESPGRNQVHPLYGWSQGHLKLLRDSGDVERVTTATGHPVSGLESAAMKRSGKLSKGAARGLKLGHSGELSTALDKHEFKRQLRARQR